MSYEQKGAWLMLWVAAGVYAVYAAIVLGLFGGERLESSPWVPAMLITIGASIVASIIVSIVIGIVTGMVTGKATPQGERTDVRDKQIYRFGEYVGRWPLIVAALCALIMAMASVEGFWIGNVIYLGFLLSAVLSSIVKIVAYRRGLPTW